MLKKIYISIFYFILTAALYGLQAAESIKVYGRTFDESLKLKEVNLTVYAAGEVYKTYYTANSNKFDVELEFGNDYLLVFNRKGYYPKTIAIKASKANEGNVDPYFRFEEWEVQLYREIKGLDVSFMDKPFGEIIFNEKKGTFEWDAVSQKEAQKRLDAMREQAALLARKDKESDEEPSSAYLVPETQQEFKPTITIQENQKEEIAIKSITNFTGSRFPIAVQVNDRSNDRLLIEERIASYPFKSDIVFRKVSHPWGAVFYFKNGVSISAFQYYIGSITEEEYLQKIKRAVSN